MWYRNNGRRFLTPEKAWNLSLLSGTAKDIETAESKVSIDDLEASIQPYDVRTPEGVELCEQLELMIS
ncbi:hypothetical protein BGZ65_000999 [Modicella reniformis]|uniref:Uncharacterized protein n=1 Tax=Modicella reniformis TaxID=1440133 RepID=A0A9P6LT44_9FUNG|nr:hypothetical protein BGZ65_000999 [Modicella reniformis]